MSFTGYRDHAFIGRGLTCARPGCGLGYHEHTTWKDVGRGGIRYPEAVLASRNGIRHVPGPAGRPMCGRRGGIYTLLTPSDGVYSMEVCERCKKL